MSRDRAGERLAVEVRVYWGADVLAVHHLMPPRSFEIRHAGVESLPRIRVGPAGVSVVVPRGAAGTIRRCATGSPAPIPMGTEEIALVVGSTVSLTLRGEGAGVYRSALAAASRIAVAVALVPVARAPRRALAPGVAHWVLAGAATAACVMLGGRWAAATVPARNDDDPVSDEQVSLMIEYLQPAPPEEPEEPAKPEVDPATIKRWCEPPFPFREPSILEPPLLDLPDLDLENPDQVCANRIARGFWSGWGRGPDPALAAVYDAYCATPLSVPFGLRGQGMLPPDDAFDRRPGELWRAQYAPRERPPLSLLRERRGKGSKSGAPRSPAPHQEAGVAGASVVQSPRRGPTPARRTPR